MNREQWSFWILLLCLAVAGGLLLALPEWLRYHQVAHAFGDAMVIAAILAGTVDLYLKRRLYQEVTRDVFLFLLAFSLPEGVQERLKLIIHQCSLLRRDSYLHYRIEPLTNRSGYVVVRLHVNQQIDNLLGQAQPYQHKTSAADPYNTDSAKIEELYCDGPDEKSSYHFRGNDLSPGSPDDLGTRWIQGKPLSIPGKNVERGKRYLIGARYSCIYKEDDSDYYEFKFPTLGVTVVVDCPDDFVVRIAPKPDDPAHIALKRWEFRRLFMPDETITIKWSKVPYANPQPPQSKPHQ